MTSNIYHATCLFDGQQYHQNKCLVVNGGKVESIVSVEQLTDEQQSQVEKLIGTIAPGYIDVQVNGGGGVLLNNQTTVAGIETIAKAHAKFGSTGIMPTLITDEITVIEQAADAMSQAIAQGIPGVLGIHFEGPHLSVEKKGVHNPAFIRPITAREIAAFTRKNIGIVMVTLAPENVMPEDIKKLVDAGVIVCLGHSNADSVTVKKALAAGATGFTHLFNAMSPFQSREPGMVGTALLDQNSWCGLIVDGHHVHYDACKLAIQAKNKGKIMLVTDAMSPVGSDEQTFELLGAVVHRNGDRLTAETGELAGSCIDMAATVKNTVEHLDCELGEALRMASKYPAEFLSRTDLGQLTAGATASFVLLDDDLSVQKTWINGVECG